MPTSSPSNVTTKEKPANSSATPTAKQPPKSSAATAKEKQKPPPVSAAAGKGSMGARLSTTPSSAGKAPSTASASSTHTASTLPADSAEAKAKSKSGGGVASFLRRKPSNKEPAAGPSSSPTDKKETKRGGVGSSLRTSLFKRSTKSKNGTDAPSPAASSQAGPSTSSSSAAATSGTASASTSGTSSAAKPPTGASTSVDKARASPDKGRASPEKGRTSPKRRTSSDNSPSGRRGSSPPKSPRRTSQTDASPTSSAKKSPSPRPAGAAAAGRFTGALTPERKEELKKQWFTDGKPLPEPAGRGRASAAGRTGAGSIKPAGSIKEPRSRPGPGETVGPPAASSRVTGSAFTAAAAKFGGVKTPAKPRPGSPKKVDKSPTSPKKTTVAPGSPKKAGASPRSPKKSVGVVLGSPKKSDRETDNPKKSDASAKPAAAEGFDDLMDAMSGFKAEAGSTRDTGAEKDGKPDSNPPAAEELVTSKVSTALNTKVDSKAPGSGGGLDDLMGAMEGFKPDGSKADQSNNGMSSPENKNIDSKKDKAEPAAIPVKDESKSSDEKGSGKEKDTNVSVDKNGSSDVAKDEKLEKSDDSKGSVGDGREPKADKTTTWRHGDSDSGELGLGGISQKDREERAHRPSAPKDETADLDFLMGQIDTAPKAPAAKAKASSEDSPKTQKKKRKSVDKDAGLDDLMDLAKGFDMSAMSKPEPVTSKAAKPDFAPSDMDKFLDMMDTSPAKPSAPPAGPSAPPAEPSAPPAGPPVEEGKLKKQDTWRTGDGDDEAMIALMNKPRDKDAPSQPPDWDIDDLLVDKVAKSANKENTSAPEKKVSGSKPDASFSGFDDFIGDSLSGDVVSDKKKQASDPKANLSAKGDAKESDKKSSEKAFSGFDDFLSESLHGNESSSAGKSEVTDIPGEKELPNKKPSESEFAAFDGFLSSSPGKDPVKGVSSEEPVAAPKKVSAVDSAPPPRAEEEVVAAVASSQTTAAPVKPKPALDRRISKEGDTRGSVPDHHLGVRDLLYDDKDKTGTKPSAPREDPKSREPALLDDLIQPAKASTTSSSPHASSKEEVVVPQAASTTEAGKPFGKNVTDEHREKPGNTRGSVPDHGHGVRDVLYDDSDKTGRKKSGSKEEPKAREPAPLEELIQPKKAAASHAAPGETHTPSSEDEEDDSISTETAAQAQAAGQPGGKKKRRNRKKKQNKEGDTRGSVPDHGHGVRDVLYDDSDKTGRKKSPSESTGDDKHRELAVVDDLIQPKKAAASHAAPAGRSPSPESKNTEDAVTAKTAHESQAAGPGPGKSANKKKQAKEGDTRGSVPDHGHGVRDVLYDDKDKTGRRKSESKDDHESRAPAALDDIIQPKKVAVSHAAAAAPAQKSTSRSPSPDEEEEDEVSTEAAPQSQAAGQSGGKKKRRNRKKKQNKEGDTRGSVPDHGHGVRDVLYDDSDKTGQGKTGTKHDSKRSEPEPLEDLIRPAKAAHVASAPGSGAAAGAEPPLVAESAAASHSAPEPARRNFSLAGLADPDQEDSDDGEELRRLIASTDALQMQLRSVGAGDSKQAEAVQQETSAQLERLERSLQERQQRLEQAGRAQEVTAAREGLQKVKQQLDASRAAQ